MLHEGNITLYVGQAACGRSASVSVTVIVHYTAYLEGADGVDAMA
jgi:hypothetical protein